jgi:hypothetical protein
MLQITNPTQNATRARQPRRRRGSYRFPIGRRAAVAAGMVLENGWTAQQAAGLLGVCPTYVGLARHLGADDRLRLARGELKLSDVYKDHLRHLAESRAQRLAEERAARMQAERAAQVRAVDDVLERVGLDRVVGRIVEHHGPEPLLEELDVALQRRGARSLRP